MHKPTSDKPASDDRAETNRRNSEHSTGPRTEAGKAASSQNARAHGLTGRITFQTPEDQAAYAAMGQKLVAEFKPVGTIEEELLNILHDAKWQMRRCRAYDEKYFMHADTGNTPPKDLTVDKLNRYLGLHTRTFFRALRELDKRQCARRRETRRELITLIELRANQPYLRRKHGLVAPQDGFVLSASEPYSLYVYLEAQAKARIAA
jgi:hypothetical protein